MTRFMRTSVRVGLAASVGLHDVWQKLVFPHWYWLTIAIAGEAFAYLGYTLAYREVVRAERGPELDVPSVAALVATGFGVFSQGGGFALDRAALQRAGMSERQALSGRRVGEPMFAGS